MGKNKQLSTKKLGKTQELKAKSKNENAISHPSSHALPAELKQLLLSLFKNSLSEILSSDRLQATIQEVKGALYDRDFQEAFSKDEYLEAYAVRWSPSRALCYASILINIKTYLNSIWDGSLSSDQSRDLKVICFGGGAAEVVAFAGLLRFTLDNPPSPGQSTAESPKDSGGSPRIELHLIDSAQWGSVVKKLENGLTNPPPLPKYARQTAREANHALIHTGGFQAKFHAMNIFELGEKQLRNLLGEGASFVTLLFTLNELYTTSIGKATALLLHLTEAINPGSLLLSLIAQAAIKRPRSEAKQRSIL